MFNASQIFISSIKHQNEKLQFKTVEIRSKSLQKPRKIERFYTHRATPKPWVAGSNPPAPAITEAKRLRFFSFWCVLFCISLSKAEMKKIFNVFRLKNPFSFSVVSVCSNRSVWYSIKKAATVSTELQKRVKNVLKRPQIFRHLRSLFYLFTPTQFLMCFNN